MSTQSIREAFEIRLSTWAAGLTPKLRVAYENVPLLPVPAPTETYLRAHTLPARSTAPALAGDVVVFRGVQQVSIVVPLNVGAGAAGAIADEIAAQFPVNLRIAREGLTVQVITPASVAPALQSESDYVVPVSFEYQANVT